MKRIEVTVKGIPGAGKSTLIFLLVQTLKKVGIECEVTDSSLTENHLPITNDDLPQRLNTLKMNEVVVYLKSEHLDN